MKTSGIYSGISIMLLFIMAFLLHVVIQAQDQDPAEQQDKWTIDLKVHGLTPVVLDTVRYTMVNYSKGLLHYDSNFNKHQDRFYLSVYRGAEKSVVLRTTISEKDLEILKHNLLFIDKQYQIQIKEWIRKDKLDLNLGEAIKDFYMTPIYK